MLPLEEQSKTAKTYLSLKEKLKFYEINQFLHQYTRHNKKISDLKEQIALLEEEISSQKMHSSEMESEKDALSQIINNLHLEIDLAKKESYDLLNVSEKLKGEQNLNLERIRQYERDNIRLKDEIKRKQQNMHHAKEQLDSLSSTIKVRREAFEELRLKTENIINRINEINKEIADYQKHINQTKGGIIQVLNRISDCKSQLTRYHTIESNFQSRLAKIEEEIESKKKELNDLSQQQVSLHNKIMSTKQNHNDQISKKSQLENRVREGRQALHTQEEQLNKEKQMLEGQSSRLKLLEDMKKGYEGFNKTIKEILTACRSNAAVSHKVCGVVASLIQVLKSLKLQ